MSTLERAIEIAVKAHRGQKDKAGAPYILHPLRVMMRLETETEMIIAILHDVIEDSTWTAAQLIEEGFSQEIVDAVLSVTKVDGESYDDFVERTNTNPMARRVKIADLVDNMNMTRIGKVTANDLRRLQRYHKAWRNLSEHSD